VVIWVASSLLLGLGPTRHEFTWNLNPGGEPSYTVKTASDHLYVESVSGGGYDLYLQPESLMLVTSLFVHQMRLRPSCQQAALP
jgi:hypothetical protein